MTVQVNSHHPAPIKEIAVVNSKPPLLQTTKELGCLGSCAVIMPLDALESKEVRGLGARSDASGNPAHKTNKDEKNDGSNGSRDDLT